MQHNFGEKDYENIRGQKLPVWKSPKYEETKKKAIELIENETYKGVLNDGDFWILMNTTKNGNVAYTGLIISHNACLKINDVLPVEKRFKPSCFTIQLEEYRKGLIGIYCDEDIYEIGEVNDVNCKNDYPYAMCLKRCFDRVVLKKSGIAQWGIYSDSEADEFKEKYEEPKIYISAEEYEELTNMYSKEEIKKFLEELNISKGSEIPKDYYNKKVDEWLKNEKQKN